MINYHHATRLGSDTDHRSWPPSAYTGYELTGPITRTTRGPKRSELQLTGLLIAN